MNTAEDAASMCTATGVALRCVMGNDTSSLVSCLGAHDTPSASVLCKVRVPGTRNLRRVIDCSREYQGIFLSSYSVPLPSTRLAHTDARQQGLTLPGVLLMIRAGRWKAWTAAPLGPAPWRQRHLTPKHTRSQLQTGAPFGNRDAPVASRFHREIHIWKEPGLRLQ